MAIHDYDLPTEPLYRRNDKPEDPINLNREIDKGTIWSGLLLGVALIIFVAYMLAVGPST